MIVILVSSQFGNSESSYCGNFWLSSLKEFSDITKHSTIISLVSLLRNSFEMFSFVKNIVDDIYFFEISNPFL